MNYHEKNYNEIFDTLDKNDGKIDSKFIDDIFYAYQIASGQGYFKTRVKAIFDYLEKHSNVTVLYPDHEVNIDNLKKLEDCFQKHDSTFKVGDLL
nr:hypothetical protein [uncultured Carboxylicivirga sp.]